MGAPLQPTPQGNWGRLSGSFSKLRQSFKQDSGPDRLPGEQPVSMEEAPPSPRNPLMDKRCVGNHKTASFVVHVTLLTFFC